MKTADAGLVFPVVGFAPDMEIWGFPDLNALTSCGPRTLKEDLARGMELVDATGRRWRVIHVRRIGHAGPLWRWLIDAILSTPQNRIEHDLESLDPLTLSDVQERCCEVVTVRASDWWDEPEQDVEIPRLLASVRATKTISELPELLGLDTFESY
jgi:hypothetical protein